MRSKSLFFMIPFLVVPICCILMFTFAFLTERGNVTTETLTVDSKYASVMTSDSGSMPVYFYNVHDASGRTQVIQSRNSLFWGKWDASEMYPKIEVGKTYTFKLAGWRFLTVYRNIISYTAN